MYTNQSIALVTGANRGIGFEVCRQLAEKGYLVLLTARNQQKAQDAAEKLQATRLPIIPMQLDIIDATSVKQAFDRISQEFGHLDALVNNAAVDYDTDQNVMTADLERVQRALETNTLGAWRVIQAFIPLLRKSQHGRIVNVSSGAGAFRSLSGSTPAYSLSKVALNALTLMSANVLKRDGILVNAICPGWVATDMGGQGGRPIEEGAASVVWGITLTDQGPTGGFFRDGQPIEW